MPAPDRRNLFKRMLMPRTWRGRSLLGGCVVVVAAVIGVGVAYLLTRPKAVSNPHVAFTVPTKSTPVTPTKKAVDNFLWPFYGYTLTRVHTFTGDKDLHPPLRRGWTFRGNAVMEFAPTISGHNLYFMDDGATIKSVNAVSGHQQWLTHLGKLSSETPAIDIKLHRLYAGILSLHGSTIGSVGGEFFSVSMKTGKVLWKFPVPSGTESSPIVVGSSVYFGDQDGTVYSVNARTGHIQWQFQTGGSVKAGLAYAGGKLYFGNYAGEFYALKASNGHEVWSASASGFLSSGNFYATPAVAFGRVYAGNTNGYMYSFSAATGRLGWSIDTGAYVYSAAAVQNTPHLGPTVYVGSYSGTIYALNARSGATRWTYDSGDAISGPISIIDNVAYFSGVYSHDTTGISAITGHRVFHFHDGAYGSMVASPNALYLDGHYVLYEFLPKRDPGDRHVAKHKTAKKATARKSSRASKSKK